MWCLGRQSRAATRPIPGAASSSAGPPCIEPVGAGHGRTCLDATDGPDYAVETLANGLRVPRGVIAITVTVYRYDRTSSCGRYRNDVQ